MEDYDPDILGEDSNKLLKPIEMIQQSSNQSMESARQREAQLKYGSSWIDEKLPTERVIETLQSLEE